MEQVIVIEDEDITKVYLRHMYQSRLKDDNAFKVFNILAQVNQYGMVPRGEENRRQIYDLCTRELGISNHSYYAALRKLKGMGLIEKVQGFGFRICEGCQVSFGDQTMTELRIVRQSEKKKHIVEKTV